MAKSIPKRILTGLGISLLIFLITYPFAIRPWQLRWGATMDEVQRPLPGDEIVPHPRVASTRAITIQARAEQVWPWLVQIGQDRGGFYSYDRLENLLGLNIHSADRIVPEWQDLSVSDTIKLAAPMGLAVTFLEPNRAVVIQALIDMQTGTSFDPASPLPENYTSTSWGWYLYEIDSTTTRLMARFRLDYVPGFANSLMWRVFVEPASFIMEQKMLRGIKRRAEEV
jgi:hypothetical protein